VELDAHDDRQVRFAEGAEPDDLVDPVHEFGLEERGRIPGRFES